MPFRYEFYIDTEKLDNVEMGFSTSRKWEEALDEARLVVPFSYLNRTPYKMFSLLTILIHEMDSYTDVTPNETQTHYYLVYSDKVDPVGAYGYYKHTVSAIEYTAKLDAYIISQLSKSRSIINNVQAPFTVNELINYNDGSNHEYAINATLKKIDVFKTMYANHEITFPQVYEPYIVTSSGPLYYRRGTAVIRTNAPLVSGTSPHTLSGGPTTWVFPKGEWEIEYGYIGLSGDFVGGLGFNSVYKFYVDMVEKDELSIYDVLTEIRTCVSKFGGIEDTVYFDSTRVFDIDPLYETYLKSVQAPQIYLEKTTARKMLVYVLAFVNALPRLEYGEDLDTLTLETYNLTTGQFDKVDVIAHSAVQNTSQIGTRNYQHITQSLSNELDEPSVYSPSQSGFQQVRSADIQLTANNFVGKLPEGMPLYMPTRLILQVPNIKITTDFGTIIHYEVNNYELNLMPRWINGEEWKLKNLTDNFPTIDQTGVWFEELGLRLNMVDNLQWNMGDTEINFSQIFGQVFQDNLLRNVAIEQIYEDFMLNPPIPHFGGSGDITSTYAIEITLPSSSNYKDWRFRVEYITDERLVIKQDKEDLSQISFYSEMQQNQEESLVNILRQSRKGYGDLQRTGNIENTFVKQHLTFDDFYEIGQKDVDGYTITQIDTVWFNDYAIARYHVTRYHNRIQQATYVNQKYRPFDNFSKSVLYRHENYTDYLIALPPNDVNVNFQDQTTKIYSNESTIRRIVEMMLGEPLTDTKKKASVALVRTDGMLDIYPETEGATIRNLIAVPVTAKGVKGSFAFTFGFKGNQSAGDGLVSKVTTLGVTNWFNQAVRYTDTQGRFTRFGFMIAKDLTLDLDDYNSYPRITVQSYILDDYIENNAYFWCGHATANEAYQRPLVWNKDPLTNANLTYQLSVLSYYMGLYVFGIDFYAKNFIVNNPEGYEDVYLYTYIDGTYYDIFEDIYVKSGYTRTIKLDTTNIVFDTATNWLKFIGISFLYDTSWAIGRPQEDGTIKLLLACNENLNGVQFKAQHTRPNVYEIGSKLPLIQWLDLATSLEVNVDLQYVRGPEYQVEMDSGIVWGVDMQIVANYGYQFDMDIPLTTKVKFLFYEGDSNPITLDIPLTIATDLEFYRSSDYGSTLDIPLTANVDFVYSINVDFGDILDVDLTVSTSFEFGANYTYEMDTSIEVTPTLAFSMGFSQDLSKVMVSFVDLIITPTYFQEIQLDVSQKVTLDFIHVATYFQELQLDIALTNTVDLQYTKAELQFANPTITILYHGNGIDGGGHWYNVIYTVKNNDTTTARVGHELNTIIPSFTTSNMVVLTTGSTSSNIEVFDYFVSAPYIVAQSRDVVGEDDKGPSNVVYWNNWD